MGETHLFGGWLRGRRRELGVSQAALAVQVGCAVVTLQKIEASERRPSRELALLMAAYFAVPAAEQEAFVAFARADTVADLPDLVAPWRAERRPPTNLPTPLTAILGRAQDEDAVRELLTQSNRRLVTIVGPPGVGKTRLAIQVAARLLTAFVHGTYFVDLTALTVATEVLPALAATLGVRENAGEQLRLTLRRHLEGKHTLLLLDNFEQLLDAAPIIVEVLQGSPWLKALVTSREPLQVRGESVYRLAPLDLPQREGMADPQALSANAAVALFVERAIAANPGFTLNGANELDVAAICVALDGLPLAIELAAANAALLSPQAILAGLADRFTTIGGGLRDLPPRQRTLRRAVDWSYDLLEEAERRVFARLGAFAGGCTMEAGLAVAGDPDAAEHTTRALIGALHDKNLLRCEQVGATERLQMLVTIHDYAAARLAERWLAESTRRRHALYYMQLAEAGRAAWSGEQREQWMARLEAERANLGAALTWAGAAPAADEAPPPRAEIGLRLAAAITTYWWLHGHIGEVRRWLGRALDCDPAADPGTAGDALRRHRAAALLMQGWMANEESDYLAGRQLLDHGLRLYRELGDDAGVAEALNMLASGQMYLGELGAAQQLYEESLQLRRKLGDQRGAAQSLGELASVALYRGDYARARLLYEEVLALYRAWKDRNHIATLGTNLATVQIYQGEYEQAQLLLAECLEIAQATGDRSNAAYTLNSMGLAAALQGELVVAVQRRSAGLRLAVEIGDKRLAAECLEGAATALAAGAEYATATRLFAAAAALRSAIGVAEAAIDAATNDVARAAARANQSSAEWAAAWAAGQSMDLEQAAIYLAGRISRV